MKYVLKSSFPFIILANLVEIYDNIVFFKSLRMDSYIKHDSKTIFVNEIFRMMSIFRVIRKIEFSQELLLISSEKSIKS